MSPTEATQSPYRKGRWTVIQLKDELKQRELSRFGNKESLIERLERDDDTQPVTPTRRRKGSNKSTPHPKSKSPPSSSSSSPSPFRKSSKSPKRSKSKSPSKSPNSTRSLSSSIKGKSSKSPKRSPKSKSPIKTFRESNNKSPFDQNEISTNINTKSGNQSHTKKKHFRRYLLEDGESPRASSRTRRLAIHKNQLSFKVNPRPSRNSSPNSSFMKKSRKSLSPKSLLESFNSPSFSKKLLANQNDGGMEGHFEEISLCSHPFLTLKYFFLFLLDFLSKSWKYHIESKPTLWSIILILIILFTVANFIEGKHQIWMTPVMNVASWYSHWFLFGIFSAIGIGSNAQSFILHLGPYIARVASTAHLCKTISFHSIWTDRIVCPKEPYLRDEITIPLILLKVLPEILAWGIGSVIGSLPPYLLAYISSSSISSSNGINSPWCCFSSFSHSNSHSSSPSRHYHSLKSSRFSYFKNETFSPLDRIKMIVCGLIEKFRIFGVLLASLIPNPLFDLLGLIYGYFMIPDCTFIPALFVGKGIIKPIVQTLFVIILFSKESLDRLTGLLQHLPSNCYSRIAKCILSFRELLLRKVSSGGLPGHLSSHYRMCEIFEGIWNVVKYGTMLYFLYSSINTLATLQMNNKFRKRD